MGNLSGYLGDVTMQHKLGSVIYMAVTADQYELPLVVTDTVIELAIKPQSVSASICKNLSGRNAGYKIVRVKL